MLYSCKTLIKPKITFFFVQVNYCDTSVIKNLHKRQKQKLYLNTDQFFF